MDTSFREKTLVWLRGNRTPLPAQLGYAFFLLIPSFAVAWLANPILPQVTDKGEYAFALVFSAIGLTLGVYILHLLGRAGFFIAPFLAVILATFSYITTLYALEPGPSFIGTLLETNYEEAKGFITFEPLGIVIGCVIAYTAFVRWTRNFFSYGNMVLPALFLAHLLFAQSRIFTALDTKEMRHASRWSMDYISDPLKYAIDFPFRDKEKVAALRALPSAVDEHTRRETDEPLLVVLVIGESLRGDHLGINGYPRDTTPGLRKEKLVNFPSARSFAAWTRESVIAIFTDRKPGAAQSAHGSFVPLFKHCGFRVATYSANVKPNRSDFSFNVLTEGAARFFAPRPDTRLVDMLQTQLAQADRELHILAPYGSHFSYKDAYGDGSAVFRPDTYTRPLKLEELPNIINSYDNTVRVADTVLSSIIDLLRPHKAMLFYVSDHGESLGENGRFFHGDNAIPEQRHIPFFFWFSDKYREAYPERVGTLESRRHETATHHHVFHTLATLAGIRSSAYDASLDLASPAALPEE